MLDQPREIPRGGGQAQISQIQFKHELNVDILPTMLIFSPPKCSFFSRIVTSRWVIEWYPQFAIVISIERTCASAGYGTQCDPYGAERGGRRWSGSVECSATLSPEPRPVNGTDRDRGKGEHVREVITSRDPPRAMNG